MQQTHAVFGELAHYGLQITDTNVTSLLKILATDLVSNNHSVSELEVCGHIITFRGDNSSCN